MIELLDHNKETYERLCDVLADNNKCALVQATGTGKSYIAGKYIEEHADTALILVPTNAIADAWEDLLAETEKEVNIITYQAFSKEPQNYLDYDVVIADEMHHLGSDVWGRKFVETYLHGENHKIIGLTATEIRYLDNSRDMAEEIFDNIRVDGCDLPTAINTGVLPTFKYVSALYCDESDFDEWKEKAGKIKDIKTQTELKGRLDVCIKNMVSVKQAVNENLTDDYRKIIVFLNNVESKETALEMFRDVFPTANFYDVDYSKQRTANNEQISRFKADRDRAILFAVDMLNEGIHIKGTDCVIMFRKTVSPQVYLQQLGRGLASGTDKMPVIFDFVGNSNSIHAVSMSEDNLSIIQKWNDKIEKNLNIIIKFYEKDLNDVLKEIQRTISIAPYTKEEIDYIKENYKKMKMSEIAERLNRPYWGVMNKAIEIGIIEKKRKWSKEEDEYLVEKYKTETSKSIAVKLGRTSSAIRTRAIYLGLTNKRIISNEEIDFIKANYKTMGTKQMSEKLDIPYSTLQAFKKKHRFVNCSSQRWSEEELDYLRENYGKNATSEIAYKLDRTIQSVTRMASCLGIQKFVFSDEEIEFIKKNRNSMTVKEISEHLGRNFYSVKNKCRSLGIKKEVSESRKGVIDIEQ